LSISFPQDRTARAIFTENTLQAAQRYEKSTTNAAILLTLSYGGNLYFSPRTIPSSAESISPKPIYSPGTPSGLHPNPPSCIHLTLLLPVFFFVSFIFLSHFLRFYCNSHYARLTNENKTMMLQRSFPRSHVEVCCHETKKFR
jgi:hypothetical protein